MGFFFPLRHTDSLLPGVPTITGLGYSNRCVPEMAAIYAQGASYTSSVGAVRSLSRVDTDDILRLPILVRN